MRICREICGVEKAGGKSFEAGNLKVFAGAGRLNRSSRSIRDSGS
jgi:hypothetical protein